MITEKTQTAQHIIDAIAPASSKVDFIRDETLVKALQYLEEKGLPGARHEEYKYCNLEAVLRKEFKHITQEFQSVNDVNQWRNKDAVTLVVLNGIYSEALSDKVVVRGLQLSTLSDMDAEARKHIATLADVQSDAFIALNTAFCSNGLHLRVEKNAEIPMPVQVIYLNSCKGQAFVNTRSLIELEEGASLHLIEQHIVIGEGKVFTNLVSEKRVAANAKLTSCIFQNETAQAYSINTHQVEVGADATYDNTTITLGGQVVRNNHQVVLSGKQSVAHLNGLFSTNESRLVDNHTLMDHRVPHCESNELYKGIINGKSTGVFNGKIFVRKDAQKTNAYQSSKNILLSDDATINTKPQLEIYANDVKCSHGTSTGKIDNNALFYLNARGIGKETAKKMLLSSFAQEIIQKIESDDLRDTVSTLFENSI